MVMKHHWAIDAWLLAAAAMLGTGSAWARSNSNTQLDSSALFIESSLEPLSPYVQQLMLYRVRLYSATDIRLSRGELSAPEHANAIIKPLGTDKRYKIRLGHRDYRVLERTYGVLAQSSGPFHLPAAQYTGFAKARRGGGALIDSYRRPVARSVRVQGRGHGVLVRARPVAAENDQWIPASALIIFDSWRQQTPLLVAGEPTSRTISISARGLTAAQLPALTPPVPEGVRIYPAPATIETVTEGEALLARRTQTFSIVADRAATFVFPKLVLPWWNTRSNARRTVATRAHTLIATAEDTAGQAQTALWPGYLAAAVLLSTIAICLWRLPLPASWRRLRTRYRATRQFRAAVRSSDAKAAREAVLTWAAARCYDDPPSTLAQVAASAGDESTRQALLALNEALYGRPTAASLKPWHTLAFKQLKQPAKHRTTREKSGAFLPSLY